MNNLYISGDGESNGFSFGDGGTGCKAKVDFSLINHEIDGTADREVVLLGGQAVSCTVNCGDCGIDFALYSREVPTDLPKGVSAVNSTVLALAVGVLGDCDNYDPFGGEVIIDSD